MKSVEEIQKEHTDEHEKIEKNAIARKKKEKEFIREVERLKPEMEKRILALFEIHKCESFNPDELEKLLGIETELEKSALWYISGREKFYHNKEGDIYYVKLHNNPYRPTNNAQNSSSFLWSLVLIIAILLILFYAFK